MKKIQIDEDLQEKLNYLSITDDVLNYCRHLYSEDFSFYEVVEAIALRSKEEEVKIRKIISNKYEIEPSFQYRGGFVFNGNN